MKGNNLRINAIGDKIILTMEDLKQVTQEDFHLREMKQDEDLQIFSAYENYKKIDNVYDIMLDFNFLYESHLHARKCKRYKVEIMQFVDNLESELWEISRDLKEETYELGKYRKFYVVEPKVRLVMALQYRDRIVQWSVYRFLNPFYDKMFIDDSYACRVGKGSHNAIARLRYWLAKVDRQEERWYYLKLDISKFFYRVDHKILLKILAKRIKDKRLMKLLDKIINSKDTKFGLPLGYSPNSCPEDLWLSEIGIPIGNLTSQLFANIYLNEVDQFCKHDLHLHYYVRYMDDIIILGPDKNYLHEIKRTIELFLLEHLSLNLNNKTIVAPVDTGITFLGYRVWSTHQLLKKQSARRIIRHTRKLCYDLRDNYITLEQFKRAITSYRGLLDKCESFGLKRKLNTMYLTIVNGYLEESRQWAEDYNHK